MRLLNGSYPLTDAAAGRARRTRRGRTAHRARARARDTGGGSDRRGTSG